MPRKPPLPPSPKQTLTLRGRKVAVGDHLPVTGTVTRIGTDKVPLVTLEFPGGYKLSFPADKLVAE